MCGGTARKFTATAYDALVHKRDKSTLHVWGNVLLAAAAAV
ncbi:hypothetical protein N183_27135 [Sinorhizobium sp. Sb3]|nr:hypothetical protein N183_27135 [Sinorhizobium sp. Sb3]